MAKSQQAMIGHLVDLHAYTNDVVYRIVRILEAADVHLYSDLISALHRLPASEFSVARLYSMLQSVRALNAQAYELVTRQLSLDLRGLSAYEAQFAAELLSKVAADPLARNLIGPEQAYSAGNMKPMRGRLMSDWASGLGVRRMNRIQDSLAIGYVEGRTVDEMVRTLRGTRAQRYADGLLNIDRREAEAVVRTAVGHYAQTAREEVFKANSDLIEALVWTSTLDTRTSETCQLRDGMRYTVDGKPIGHELPWLGGPGNAHWNCRSSCYPETALGGALGLSRVERASMDGPVASKVTYATWIKAQSAARQDEVLGPSRGRLMRGGDYTLSSFYDNKGRFLTLDELRSRDQETFKELGL